MVVVGLTQGIPIVTIGTRWPLEDFLASTAVHRTGRPARSDHTGHRNTSGQVADSLRQMNYVSTVAAPITVEGRLWGVMTVSDQRKPLPPDTEKRVANFTELVATAIADSESRSHLEQLASEQAALRRVATLVAQDVPASELFSAVAGEVGTLFGADFTAIVRYEPDPTYVTTIATWAADGQHAACSQPAAHRARRSHVEGRRYRRAHPCGRLERRSGADRRIRPRPAQGEVLRRVPDRGRGPFVGRAGRPLNG